MTVPNYKNNTILKKWTLTFNLKIDITTETALFVSF